MTAYGRGQHHQGESSWTVELRSVNSRYLDLHFRLPSELAALEDNIKKLVSTRLTRGRVNISVSLSGPLQTSPRLRLNLPLAREFKRVLDELRRELGIDGDPGMGPFLANRDIIISEDAAPDLEAWWAALSQALAAALDEAEAMRVAEGAALAQDLGERLDRLEGLLREAAARSPQIVENYRLRLKERLAKLLDDPHPDPQRLATEVAITADRCDITEEAVRAQSHIEQFRAFLKADQPVGRKLDFLIQELNREANTMGSKSPDSDSARLIVEIKAELERVREQVQNVE